MGLGAMINGVLDMEGRNMSGPLLSKSFGVRILIRLFLSVCC